MKKIIPSIALAVLVGVLVIPSVVLGACGPRPDCGDCVDQETCEAELLCYWDTDTCYNQAVITVNEGGINSLLANVGNLFSDASLYLWVIIGLPLGFYLIHKVLGLLPKK
jgi:hypothetical protein